MEALTQIMTKPSYGKTKNILFVDPLRVFFHQTGPKLSRQETHPNGVLEPVVRRIGVDQVAIATLLQVTETLELLGVNNEDASRRQLDVTMDTEGKVNREKKSIFPWALLIGKIKILQQIP